MTFLSHQDVLAPRNRNIRGPLTSLAPNLREGATNLDFSHGCLAWRIAGTLTKASRSSIPECLPSCTSAPLSQSVANPAQALPGDTDSVHTPPVGDAPPGPPPPSIPIPSLPRGPTFGLPPVQGIFNGHVTIQQVAPTLRVSTTNNTVAPQDARGNTSVSEAKAFFNFIL